MNSLLEKLMMPISNKTLACFFHLCVSALFFCSPAIADIDELKVSRIITPNGQSQVSMGQQIVVEFNQPVIALGDNEVKADSLPISIEPGINCHWRWMDSRSLLCRLDAADKLTPASQYTLSIAPGLTTINGAAMKTAVEHTFTTELPDIRSSRFDTWVSPGLMVLQLEFNLAVTKVSIEAHVYFDTDGKRYAVKAFPLDDGDKNSDEAKPHAHLWQITPVEEMPLDSHVQLKLEPGLSTPSGPLVSNAERTEIKFYTFPEFKFLGISCFSVKDNKMVLVSKSSLEPAVCEPQSTAYLKFSSPVSRQAVQKGVTIARDLANGRKDYDPWSGGNDYSLLDQPHYQGNSYDIWLPEYLQAFQVYHFRSDNLVDVFGRRLSGPMDLSFMTTHRQPKLELGYRNAVLEKQVDTQMPAYITNLETLDISYRTITGKGLESDQIHSIKLPKVTDLAYAYPLPMRELLQDQSGAISGTIDIQPRPENFQPLEFFTQVTPYNLQVKLGHFNSLIWVTDLATGLPVAAADVSIFIDDYSLENNKDSLAQVKTDEEGLARLPGLLEMTPDLALLNVWQADQPRLMIRVQKGNDMSLLPIGHEYAVWSRVSFYNRQQHGHTRAWGTTAQAVYKPGSQIQYKLYIRDQDNQTLIPPPDLDWKLEIRDPGNKVVSEIKSFRPNEFGAFDGEYNIPKNASVGWYRFILTHTINSGTEQEKQLIYLEPLKVLVSDFTPSPFKVSTELNGQLFKPGNKLEITTSARLHAGGPYTQAQTRIMANLVANPFIPDNTLAKGFQFDTHDKDSSTTLLQKPGQLSNKGNLDTKLLLSNDLDYKKIVYGTLRVESSVQDDRGKRVARYSSAKFVARDRLVGLKNTGWVYQQGQDSAVQYLVVDDQGQTQAGSAVEIAIERSVIKASRVKSAGNAYITQYLENWAPVASCSGVSSLKVSRCHFKPDEPGNYRITATIEDTKGRQHQSQIGAWTVGQGHVIWQQPSNNNLSIIAENKNPKIGDQARYLVKNPYPGSKALITVERYGILKSWVEDFSDSTEIIEFPVLADYMPGFYLSVTVFSPRVEKPLSPDNVDLGKPGFSMGYLKVAVVDPVKQLEVSIKGIQESYQPGDEVELTLTGKPKTATLASMGQPMELAIVVLDEAVFDLIPEGEKYFDPYQGFYSLDSLDVANYNLISRLIGRQKFEKKGADPGGDGGSAIHFRSIDQYIGYWNPSLILPAGESKTVSFKAPDNLTGWRVFAMAVSKHDRLGLGQATFKVNKTIEIRPVLPNQVTSGDEFQAGFSVMNRTDKTKDISIEIIATGAIEEMPVKLQKITLQPFKLKTVWLPVKTTQAGIIRLLVSARSGDESDGLSHMISVHRRAVTDTVAEYGSFTEAVATMPIRFPEAIRSNTGELNISISATVIGNVEGAFRYMRDYPYGCWEQRLGKSVMANHYQQLQEYMPADLKWPDSQQMTNSMLGNAASYQAPNGGMAFWINRDEYVSPYLSAYSALAFSWLKKAGFTIPKNVEEFLHTYLATLLKRNTMPEFYTQSMVATVRAVALAALAGEGKISKDDLQRYRDHVPQMSLFGQAHYLMAANSVDNASEIADDVFDSLIAKSVQSACKIQFNEEKLGDDYQRILTSPLRTQCALLSAFMQNAKKNRGKNSLQNLPLRMVRTITQSRGKRDHWENTQENLFCMNALSDYARIYEDKTVATTVTTRLDEVVLGTAEIKSKRNSKVEFRHKINPSDPGRKAQLEMKKPGDSRLYFVARMDYEKLAAQGKRKNSGIDIRREYSVEKNGKWHLLSSPMEIQRGDLIRVDLYLELPTARNFVVVDDPVPGGLEPVNRQLATSSGSDVDAGSFRAADGSWWFEQDDWQTMGYSPSGFYHQELRHHSARFFSDYLNPGHYHLSYTAQAIASGQFTVPAVHTEEMYDTDIYGRGLSAILKVAD